jgi:hypothetical protein
VIALSKKDGGNKIHFFKIQPEITYKASITLNDQASNPPYSRYFQSMAEAKSLNRLLVLATNGDIEVWDVSNVNSSGLTKFRTIFADGVGIFSNIKSMNGITKAFYSFFDSTNSKIEIQGISFDPVDSYYKVNGNTGTDAFQYQVLHNESDDLDDRAIAITFNSSPNPQEYEIYSFETQEKTNQIHKENLRIMTGDCDYSRQGGTSGNCKDCYTDLKFSAAGGNSFCNALPNVKFLRYTFITNE